MGHKDYWNHKDWHKRWQAAYSTHNHWGRRSGGGFFFKTIIFLVGLWVGVKANQRYELPPRKKSDQLWEEGTASGSGGSDNLNELKNDLNEIMDRLKAMEKKYRRNQPDGDAPASASNPTNNAAAQDS